MYNRIACVLLICLPALLLATPFEDCGSKVGHYTAITVSGCTEADQSCILRRKTNATIGIQFDVEKDITAVTAVVHGVLSGVPVPFPISNPDACAFQGSGLTCPLSKAGGPYTYTTTLFVEKAYPRIHLKVKWELKDQDSQDIVCVEIPAKIE